MKFLALFFFLFLISCDRFGDNNLELLLGKWELKQAFRNERPTESLDDLYMEFFENGQLKTNLMGTEEMYEFDYEKGKVIQKSIHIEPVTYTIESISDSSLILTTSLKNYNFRFVMNKSS